MLGVIVLKVRIMGYHPQNTVELKDEDLPWATVLIPATAGSGKGGKGKPIRIQPSDVVIGFFLDGDDAQQPVIFGVIGNSQYSVNRNLHHPSLHSLVIHQKQNLAIR